MINIDFTLGIALYVFFILGAILLIWLFNKKQKDKDFSLEQKFIWFCSICSYTYVNTNEEEISLCPRCGSYNKKIS